VIYVTSGNGAAGAVQAGGACQAAGSESLARQVAVVRQGLSRLTRKKFRRAFRLWQQPAVAVLRRVVVALQPTVRCRLSGASRSSVRAGSSRSQWIYELRTSAARAGCTDSFQPAIDPLSECSAAA